MDWFQVSNGPGGEGKEGAQRVQTPSFPKPVSDIQLPPGLP